MRVRWWRAVALLGILACADAGAQQLNVVCSVQAEWCTLAANEFQRATGIKVALTLKGSGESMAQLAAEKANPKADIFIGGSSEFHDPLGKQGLLEAYISPNAKDIAAQFKEPTGLWTGWYTGIFGFISNNDRLTKEIGGKKPATWDDLLDPAWKQKLVLPSPLLTGGGYIFIATQIFRFNKDEDRAMAYMKSLHASIAQYIPTSPGALTLIDQGQFVGDEPEQEYGRVPFESQPHVLAEAVGNQVEVARSRAGALRLGALDPVLQAVRIAHALLAGEP